MSDGAQHDAGTGEVLLEFSRPGRTWTTIIAVLATWALCLVGALVFSVNGLILTAILLLTLPAIRDLWKGHSAGLRITPGQIAWHTGPRTAEVALAQVDHVRLVTRLDFSVRAALVLNSGRKLRIPAEATPPVQDLDLALTQAGATTKRHHFSPL